MERDTNFVRLLFPGNRFGHRLLTSGKEMAGQLQRGFVLTFLVATGSEVRCGGPVSVCLSCST